MQTLICYTSDSRAYIKWLENGRPASKPADVPFFLPDETRNGDRYLLYVGGRDQTFVGWGTVQSNWRDGTKEWKGKRFLYTRDHLFREPISGSDVLASTGFKIPRLEKVVEESLSTAVWRAARGKPLTHTDRAVEGILTESRSRSRNAGLRLAALQRAGGVCEGCGVNFAKRHGGLGSKCLVVHHKKQLKDTDQPVETKLSDLAVVCANCHMMIHVNRDKALTLSQLKKRLGRH
jgi:hypothetical protein